MIRRAAGAVSIPGLEKPVSLALSPALRALREKALEMHGRSWRSWGFIVEHALSDARAWAARDDGEDWQTWRARRFAARLQNMPLDIEPGERVVGKPVLREPTPAEEAELEKANEVLASVPPFPGGDGGHFHPDYEKLLRVGVGGILDEIDRRQTSEGTAEDQHVFYDACRIAMRAFGEFISRVGRRCEATAADAGEEAAELRKLAGICERIASAPPQTFHEAAELMFLTLIASWFGEDHVMTCYGRMDRTLYPFYRRDAEAGRITPAEALEIISCMYIQLNRICPYGLADGVIVGGRDAGGRYVTNDLTYLCLAARQATRLDYPTVGVAWHEDAPGELMDFAVRMLATGIGDPAFFNDDVVSGGLRAHGVSEADCRNYMNSTCVEIKTVGNANIWVATRYFNCCAAMLEVMRKEAEGELPPAGGFDEFCARIRPVLADEVRQTADYLDEIWRRRAETGCFPFASCLIRDCLERGLDHDRGGARYNWAENSFVGLANLTDSLVAVRELVYERKEFTLTELHLIVDKNFEAREPLRQRIMKRLPKYGNDDDRADRLAAEWARFLVETTESNSVGGHPYVPGFFCHINHAALGAQTGATPDGRLAGAAFADGAGAAQGRETNGPTASMLSTTKWPHERALGGLVHNVRFSESLLATEAGRNAVRAAIETYLKRGGFEIQINVVSGETLRKAQERPEDYRDLLVRVAGYSDYFTTLPEKIQEEVIMRTEFDDA